MSKKTKPTVDESETTIRDDMRQALTIAIANACNGNPVNHTPSSLAANLARDDYDLLRILRAWNRALTIEDIEERLDA